ncbi:uL15 family ribosomal protein [Candidatus Woesearchaeota archaeon]|nr:uL15 family ribosomal protein [Candidatus Woesearchaeota archaeon]
MATRKRKKNSRMRGSKTHGWGAMKKHRGSGNRGGVGMAGTGKRADCKKPSFEKKGKGYFGKYGFKKRKNKKEIKIISLGEINKNIERWISEKLATKEGELFVVELKKLGYHKVLSNGPLTRKMKIKADCASANAIEKAEEHDCIIELPKKPAKEEEEKKEKKQGE